MDENLRLLLLQGSLQKSDQRLGFRIDRSKVLNAISSVGAKVRHDSGGRLLVISVSKETEAELARLLPEARIVAVDADPRQVISDLDPTESLFFDALKIRTSKNYRDAKRQRKYGESPEEQQLMSGPCVRDTL